MSLRLTISALILLAALLARAAPAAVASTQPVESKEVEKDSVAVTLVMSNTTISTDEQPEFIVRFRNVGKEGYRNLYDVAAYWNWTIELINTDPHAESPGPWRLHMNILKMRVPLEHRQIKPGEFTDVSVNLNDPTFTFDYVYAGVIKHLISPVRHLPPGHYRLTVAASLVNPFGPGYFEWAGPVTTAAVELTITQAPQRTVTDATQAAYDAAIARVTDKLDSGGRWLNGISPPIDLPKDAKSESVIDSAVNNSILESKAYRVLDVKPLARKQLPGEVSGMAALLQIGKTHKVVVFFPTGATGWWSRFYDAEVVVPSTLGAAGDGAGN
jgi:hypothetical protein